MTRGRLRELSLCARLSPWLALVLVAAAGPAWAADTCAAVTAEVGGGEPEALARQLEQQARSDASGPRALWLAATTLRCSLPTVPDQSPRCLRAGLAKSLYDKFVQDTDGSPKAVKRERSDAQKAVAQLRADHGETCAHLALKTAKEGRHGEAAQLYESVFVLSGRQLALFNAARACELGSLWGEAEVYYTAYMALPISWRERRDAVAKLVEIQRRLATSTGDSVQKAQLTASDAKAAAQRAETQAKQADAKAAAAEQRARDAERRAAAAEQQAQAAQTAVRQAEQRAAGAEQRAYDAQSRAHAAAQRAEQLEQALQGALQRIHALEAALQASGHVPR